jgi:hypothetical protein
MKVNEIPKSPPLTWRQLEYMVLSEKYYHEDSYYMQVNSFLFTLNAALATLYSSNFELFRTPFFEYCVPIIGFLSSLVWLQGLIRVRYLCESVRRRMATIENELEESGCIEVPRISVIDKSGDILERLPTTYSFQLIPSAFMIIWLIVPLML